MQQWSRDIIIDATHRIRNHDGVLLNHMAAFSCLRQPQLARFGNSFLSCDRYLGLEHRVLDKGNLHHSLINNLFGTFFGTLDYVAFTARKGVRVRSMKRF